MPHFDFVVPDEPQWPYWMVNMPLGLWSAVFRVQQTMVEEHYIERKRMLETMDYVFWLPPGNIPRKYYEPLE
jgi:hypothetical protein